MKEKTIEKVAKVTKSIKTYIAEDGKEFNSKDECLIYENECFLNYCLNKYKIQSVAVPAFICDDRNTRGISFYFPQDGDKDEVIKLLVIFQNYEITNKDDKMKIYCTRYLSNVRDSDFEIKISFELKKGDKYLFYFSWEEFGDTYDDFYNQVISKEIAMTELEKEIKNFKDIFATREVEEDLKDGCPDLLCEDCTKEDCTVRKLGLVSTEEQKEVTISSVWEKRDEVPCELKVSKEIENDD